MHKSVHKSQGKAGEAGGRFRQGGEVGLNFWRRKSAVPAAQAVQLRGREQHPFTGLRGFTPQRSGGAAALSGGAGSGAGGGRRRMQADPAQRRCAGVLRGRGDGWEDATVSGTGAGGSGAVRHQRVSGAVSGLPAGIRRGGRRNGAGSGQPGSGGAAVRTDGAGGTAGGRKPVGVQNLRPG